MEPFTLGWAAEQLNADIPETAAQTEVRGICTDTRQDTEGTLFFALKGENADGHQYLRKAFERGVVAAIVSEPLPDCDGVQIVVPDTLRALGDLARAYRLQFNIPVVGITGSVGKTSTKEMTAAILRTKYNVLANEKNFNNEIGVPLTLFRLNKSHEVAVIEMGMRGLGEIDRLAEIACPTIGVITNIGYAHIERLGSQEKIAEAKSELLARLPANGVAVLPADSAFLPYLKSRVTPGAEIITFGRAEEATIRLVGNQVIYKGETADLDIPAMGVHHVENAATAIAACLWRGYGLQDVAHALSNWYGAEGRMTAIHLPDGTIVLDDCYNASVESMTAALRTLREISGLRKIAVLGDMKELGDFSDEAHRMIGREVVKNRIDVLITVGKLAKKIGSELARPKTHVHGLYWRHAGDTEHAIVALRTIPLSQAVILVKGSRSMHMETIVKAITGQESANAHA
jgi:UDP-N-acetylmuramoyl-tripeptide--D-alanyl-D-alanine ligase